MKGNLRGVILLRPNVHNVVTLPFFVIYQCIYSKYSHSHFISSPVTIQFLIFLIPFRDTLMTLEQKGHTHATRKHKQMQSGRPVDWEVENM